MSRSMDKQSKRLEARLVPLMPEEKVHGNCGEHNGQAKLSAREVAYIRSIYRPGIGPTLTRLSRRYGVGIAALSKVVNGQNWRHVLPAEAAHKSNGEVA